MNTFVSRALDVSCSIFASVLRLGAGWHASHRGPRPEQPIELYEFEACPFCRKVREALSMLDLQAVIYPCPRGGTRYRPSVVKRGREMFPFMMDPNTGEQLYESHDIIEYLYHRYGNRNAPWWLKSDITIPLGSLASAARLGRGQHSRAGGEPKQALELYSFEASPYCRLVREALCELEISHRLINVGKQSSQRAAFIERSGRMMVPWLHDPNTGTEMFESADIVAYLRRTYAR